jgi:hypothetical protein
MGIVAPVLLGGAGGTEWTNTLGCDSCFITVAGTCEGRDTGAPLRSEVNGAS